MITALFFSRRGPLLRGNRRSRLRNRRAFTLIEMLLVIVIIGIITAVTLPQFVKSMHGNRLKSAARTVIGAGRYARSMAVLQQRPMELSFDLDNGSLQVIRGAARNSDRLLDFDDDRTSGLDDGDSDVGIGGLADAATSEDSDRKALAESKDDIKLERKLEKVEITQVEIDGEESVNSGVCRILYESNGRCTPYKVMLEDSSGMRILIKVDALASAVTERGGR